MLMYNSYTARPRLLLPYGALAREIVSRFSVAALAGRRSWSHALLRPLIGCIGVQRQGMDLPHQLTYGGVDLLMALDRIQASKLLADDHRLVMGFQTPAVHVAFIQHIELLGLQACQSGLQQIDLRHRDCHSGLLWSQLGGHFRQQLRSEERRV